MGVVRIFLLLHVSNIIGPAKRAHINEYNFKRDTLRAHIYIYVLEKAWHPPEGKCHVLCTRR